MKQTVEEAAHEWDTTQFGRVTNGVKIELTEEKHSQFLKDAFTAGSAWQKQQGIDWIRCDERLSELTVDHLHCKQSVVLLVSNGELMDWARYTKQESGSTGWIGCHFTPTHWVIVNLPKTDE